MTSLKSSEDSKRFKTSKKSLDDQFSSNTERISKLAKDLQNADPDAGAKVTALLYTHMHACILYVTLLQSCILAI